MSNQEEFQLFDLKVEVVAPEGAKLWCGAKIGDYFELKGEMMHLPPNQGISIYSLSSVLPLLAAKQRSTSQADWMSTDCEVACPDPNCPSRLRITRTNRRTFQHSETTATPLTTMPLARIPNGHEISRIIKGGWHLAGGHGDINPDVAVDDMAKFAEAGIFTFDCADIYTGVEELIGKFRAKYPELAKKIRVHTKCVPDLASLATLKPEDVSRTIYRSCDRLGVNCLDLVQFHWWDFSVPGHVQAALELTRLKEIGKIANVAVTNYDTAHLRELIEAGVPVVAHQLQYSLLDERPKSEMLKFCKEHNIVFLCYGTVAGGFLSDNWLNKSEPMDLATLPNRSLVKYKLIIDDFGGWTLFQELLRTLRCVADKHGCDIATVAVRAVLDRDNVAAAIVGATNTHYLAEHQKIADLKLDDSDLSSIEAVLSKRQGPVGDCYLLERDRTGRHGRIMKYNLQK